jgi:hypothetical protein
MYLWQAEYISAISETDSSQLPRRIYKAIAAIEQRLLAPVEHGSAEEQALKKARELLLALKAEKLNGHFTEGPNKPIAARPLFLAS